MTFLGYFHKAGAKKVLDLLEVGYLKIKKGCEKIIAIQVLVDDKSDNSRDCFGSEVSADITDTKK